MTTLKQFKKYLETLPEDTEIQVIQSRKARFIGLYNAFEVLDLDDNVNFWETTSGRKVLELGNDG